METPARLEGQAEETYATESRRLDEAREQLERVVAKCEAVEALGRRERREQLPDALTREETWRKAVEQRAAALEQIEPPAQRPAVSASLPSSYLTSAPPRLSPLPESSRPGPTP